MAALLVCIESALSYLSFLKALPADSPVGHLSSKPSQRPPQTSTTSVHPVTSPFPSRPPVSQAVLSPSMPPSPGGISPSPLRTIRPQGPILAPTRKAAISQLYVDMIIALMRDFGVHATREPMIVDTGSLTGASPAKSGEAEEFETVIYGCF